MSEAIITPKPLDEGGVASAAHCSTFVDARVERIDVEYGHRDRVGINGDIVERRFTGVNLHRITARDIDSGILIENLPAAMECWPGDIVRVTVQVIKSNT